jgi:anti-sigma-K factor RskA
MQHPDSDRLAATALEPAAVDADVAAHLDTCATCRGEVDDLRDLVGVVRDVRHERLEPPPPQVWQGVVDELGLGGRRAPRRRPLVWAAAAAVVGLGVGSLTTWALVRQDDPAPLAGRVVRTADLEPLPAGGATAAGLARLLQTTEGTEVIEVRAPDLEPADGHFEVWLLRPDSTQMVSLGVLPEGDVAHFTVPSALLADGYTLVDVSDEPDDGEPTHSGDSVLRGDLAG